MFNTIKKIIKNPYTLAVISKMFGVMVGLLFTLFQSVYLGAEIKGQVATVNSITSITSILLGFGIYHAYPYFKRNSKTDVMPIFLRLGLLFLVIYSSISAAGICFLQLSPKIIAVLILTPLLTYDSIVSYITLVEVPNKRSITDMGVVLSELLVLIILWFTARPSFIIGVFVIAFKDVTKALLFTFWWRKRFFAPSESLFVWMPRLARFGFFPMLSFLMTTLNYRVDVLMLNGRVADASIGVYSVGVLLAERVWMIPDAMKGVMISNITKGKDAHETTYVIRICNTVCLVIIAGIIVFGKPFLDMVFGEEYRGAYQITLILLAGVFSMIYYKLIASYNNVMGKQVVSFFLLGIGVICNVIANLILIPKWGIYGAGAASVISYAVCSMLFIFYFCHLTGISFGEMLFVQRKDLARLKARLFKH